MNTASRYNRRRLRSSYFTTIVSMSLVLFMLGVLGLLLLNSRKISNHVKENIGFSIILEKKVPLARIMKLKKRLDAAPFVKSAEYISPKQAAQDLQSDLGEDFVDFLGFNPLFPSIDLRLTASYANMDSLRMIEKKVLANKGVKEVYYQKSLVKMVNKNTLKIASVILLFSLFLLLVSVMLIHNTIRLAVHAKRFLIRSMQLVGATRAFIRAPFVRTGIWHGVLAALLAMIGLSVLIYFITCEFPKVVGFHDMEYLLILFAGLLMLSILLSWWSNRKAVNRYLKAPTDDLYVH